MNPCPEHPSPQTTTTAKNMQKLTNHTKPKSYRSDHNRQKKKKKKTKNQKKQSNKPTTNPVTTNNNRNNKMPVSNCQNPQGTNEATKNSKSCNQPRFQTSDHELQPGNKDYSSMLLSSNMTDQTADHQKSEFFVLTKSRHAHRGA